MYPSRQGGVCSHGPFRGDGYIEETFVYPLHKFFLRMRNPGMDGDDFRVKPLGHKEKIYTTACAQLAPLRGGRIAGNGGLPEEILSRPFLGGPFQPSVQAGRQILSMYSS